MHSYNPVEEDFYTWCCFNRFTGEWSWKERYRRKLEVKEELRGPRMVKQNA